MENVYGHHANKYYELGLIPVPISKGHKGPRYNGWTETFCYKYPTQETIDKWSERCAYDGIGLVCGKNSGVIAIDFDFTGDYSDRLEQMVLGVLPPSPVVKKGRKGWTRFYKYNANIKNTSINRGPTRFIDILSDGKQTVMPPTIHPETNEPYIWLSPDTLLDYDLDDLPDLSVRILHDLQNIADMPAEAFYEFESDDKSRHDKIFGFIMRQSERAENIDELIKQTIQFDEQINGKTEKGEYFNDPKYKKNLNPFEACKRFVTRACDWKKRKANDNGLDWNIGKTTVFWGEDGKSSPKYGNFCSFLQFYYEDIRYDPITRCGHWYDKLRDKWMPIENRIKEMESKSMEVGVTPTNVERHLQRYINTLDAELIVDIPRWDGKDHIGSMCVNVEFKNINMLLAVELFKEWMASVFRRVDNPENQNHFLILKGAQGIGKDTFINHMCKGFGNYFGEISFDAKKKETAQVIAMLLIGVVPEFDDTHKTSISEIKSLITQRGEVMRTPYMKKPDYVPFHTSFISSINFDHILRDSSGNRRFMLFDVGEIDWDFKKVDPMQVLAQSYQLYLDNYRATFEARAAMNALILDETPGNSEDLFIQDAVEIISKARKMVVHSQFDDSKVRWHMVSKDMINAGRQYGYKVQRIQQMLKKHSLSSRDKKSTFYDIPENA